MASITLAAKRAIEEHSFAQQRVRIERETDSTPVTSVAQGATAGGDERKLRGIPAIGRGVTGAILGSVPHSVR